MKFNKVYYSDKNPCGEVDFGDMWIQSNGNISVRGRSRDGWIPIPAEPAEPMPDPKETDFYDYLNKKFGLTKEEFIDILKEKHPETLI